MYYKLARHYSRYRRWTAGLIKEKDDELKRLKTENMALTSKIENAIEAGNERCAEADKRANDAREQMCVAIAAKAKEKKDVIECVLAVTGCCDFDSAIRFIHRLRTSSVYCQPTATNSTYATGYYTSLANTSLTNQITWESIGKPNNRKDQ